MFMRLCWVYTSGNGLGGSRDAELVERTSAQGGGIRAAIPAKTANIVARSIAMMSSSDGGGSKSIARLMFTL